VQLISSPGEAEVRLPSGETVVTPAEVKLRWVPFGHQVVRVWVPGYRPLKVDLRESDVRLGHYITHTLFRPKTLFGEPHGEVEFVLVPKHGKVGTWDAESVPD
jgi:hypothetical protein